MLNQHNTLINERLLVRPSKGRLEFVDNSWLALQQNIGQARVCCMMIGTTTIFMLN